jgi:hypothetical protein
MCKIRKFSELGIENIRSPFIGPKIEVSKIINREIIVYCFKITESKYPKNRSGKCLYLQIEIDGGKRVVFTGSDVLINTVLSITEEQLPFSTTIIKDNGCYLFS